MRRWMVALCTTALFVTIGPSAHGANEVASGQFTMTTARGVLPTWTSAGITIIGIAPATVTTSRFSTDATVELPVVARSRSASATAGGFRIVNTKTNDSVRCLIPTVDTKALVVDCLTSAGYNTALFTIEEIATKQSFTSSTTRTTIYQGMDMRLTTAGAQLLTRELGANVFSTSVQVADGALTLTRAR